MKPKLTLPLEVGKKYVTRCGGVVTATSTKSNGPYSVIVCDGRTYLRDGPRAGSCAEYGQDIVSDYIEEKEDAVEKYYTIDQLMDGKTPGEIKLTKKSWHSAVCFQPYFKDKDNGFWHGTDQSGCHCKHNDQDDTWTLYKEPRNKVAKYLWAAPINEFKTTYSIGVDAYSQKPAFFSDNQITDRPDWIRLDWSKIEVEE